MTDQEPKLSECHSAKVNEPLFGDNDFICTACGQPCTIVFKLKYTDRDKSLNRGASETELRAESVSHPATSPDRLLTELFEGYPFMAEKQKSDLRLVFEAGEKAQAEEEMRQVPGRGMNITLDEKLNWVKQLLATPRWNYSYKPHDAFFPSDLLPHNTRIKRVCKQLAEAGLLKLVSSGGRWGNCYQVPEGK